MDERFYEVTIRIPGDLYEWTNKLVELENARRDKSDLKRIRIQDLLIMQIKLGLPGMRQRELSLQRREGNTTNIELAKLPKKIDRQDFIGMDERPLNGFLPGLIALILCIVYVTIGITRHQFNLTFAVLLFATIPTAFIYKLIKDKKQNQSYRQMIEDTKIIIDQYKEDE